EGQTELRAELVEGQFGNLRLAKNKIGRFPDRGQIVHECSRPIEDNVANHVPTLREAIVDANQCMSAISRSLFWASTICSLMRAESRTAPCSSGTFSISTSKKPL